MPTRQITRLAEPHRNQHHCTFRRAASLTKNIPERTVLLQRAADCAARTQRITP
jgi:hypothetical protein